MLLSDPTVNCVYCAQALSSMRRRGGKTLVGAGRVILQILIALEGVG